MHNELEAEEQSEVVSEIDWQTDPVAEKFNWHYSKCPWVTYQCMHALNEQIIN